MMSLLTMSLRARTSGIAHTFNGATDALFCA